MKLNLCKLSLSRALFHFGVRLWYYALRILISTLDQYVRFHSPINRYEHST